MREEEVKEGERGRDEETEEGGGSHFNPVSEVICLVQENQNSILYLLHPLIFVTGMNVHVQTYMYCLCVSISIDCHRLYPRLTTASHHLHIGRAGELDTRDLDTFSCEYFLQQELLF